MLFSRSHEVAALASSLPKELRFGTSSWTYPGWTGLIYQHSYPKTGSSAKMLKEYAQWPLFRTAGVDSFFYRPPSEKTLASYREVLPEGFPLVMKVWETITSYGLRSPRHRNDGDSHLRPPRQDPGQAPSGARSGANPSGANPDWLNPTLCVEKVIAPAVEHLGSSAGVFLFELEAIPKSARMNAAKFAEHLDRFLGALPSGQRYAVEIRSPELLEPEYFAALKTHGVAHVFNSWTRMPSIGEQLLDEDAFTADFTVVRALLRPGRTYNDAVDAFSPYDRIQDPYPEGRRDIVSVIDRALSQGIRPWVLVNNRFEGSAPYTIESLAQLLVQR